VKRAVVNRIVYILEEEFGEEAPLTKTRGKDHDFFGMTLYSSHHLQVRVSMEDYIKSLVADSPEDMAGVAPTPIANHLLSSILKIL